LAEVSEAAEYAGGASSGIGLGCTASLWDFFGSDAVQAAIASAIRKIDAHVVREAIRDITSNMAWRFAGLQPGWISF